MDKSYYGNNPVCSQYTADRYNVRIAGGMSLREYAAIALMASMSDRLLEESLSYDDDKIKVRLESLAVILADRLIAELERTKPTLPVPDLPKKEETSEGKA